MSMLHRQSTQDENLVIHETSLPLAISLRHVHLALGHGHTTSTEMIGGATHSPNPMVAAYYGYPSPPIYAFTRHVT
jgi:hypothetical protein